MALGLVWSTVALLTRQPGRGHRRPWARHLLLELAQALRPTLALEVTEDGVLVQLIVEAGDLRLGWGLAGTHPWY